MDKHNYLFKLYITGNNPKSERAIANLLHFCEQEFGDQFHSEIIDVTENPQAAEDHGIIAVPTLIRTKPAPERRVIGDLSNIEKVREALDLAAKPSPDSTGEKS